MVITVPVNWLKADIIRIDPFLQSDIIQAELFHISALPTQQKVAMVKLCGESGFHEIILRPFFFPPPPPFLLSSPSNQLVYEQQYDDR